MVLDSLTGTTGGPELPPDEFAKWMDKPNTVNRYFAELGYTGINVNQKAFAEGPYGRERQARGPKFENNNRLTTEATARLMRSIAEHKIVTPERCNIMLTLLHRDFAGPAKNPDDQAHAFSSSFVATRLGILFKSRVDFHHETSTQYSSYCRMM